MVTHTLVSQEGAGLEVATTPTEHTQPTYAGINKDLCLPLETCWRQFSHKENIAQLSDFQPRTHLFLKYLFILAL